MKRILLLYTGGTIGCEGDPLAPMSAARFAQALAMHNLLPSRSADVVLLALARPLDSASMQPADWIDIAEALLAAWADFDGFVILHGTDTLAFTASALSFLLAGADKPVVVTGSQRPLSAPHSDAPRNLSDAVAVASGAGLREVVVCFAGTVLRGNRCFKRSASALDAFASPNWPALGEVKTGALVLHADAMLPAKMIDFDAAAVLLQLDTLRRGLPVSAVWAIQLHPGFPAALLSAALALPVPPRGWVLACYGTGNAPQADEFLAALRAARQSGVVVLAITQTGHGAVDLQTYLAGSGLALAGVIAGGDLSLPAAVSKLQLLLAKGLSPEEVAQALGRPIAGEMSAPAG